MANIKSAIKRIKVNDKKRALNGAQKAAMRTSMKQVEKYVDAKDAEKAQEALKVTVKHIDKAVSKGIIHKNNGDRQKARLMQKVKEISA
jgi:small subunit ribosomal protein S20